MVVMFLQNMVYSAQKRARRISMVKPVLTLLRAEAVQCWVSLKIPFQLLGVLPESFFMKEKEKRRERLKPDSTVKVLCNWWKAINFFTFFPMLH